MKNKTCIRTLHSIDKSNKLVNIFSYLQFIALASISLIFLKLRRNSFKKQT